MCFSEVVCTAFVALFGNVNKQKMNGCLSFTKIHSNNKTPRYNSSNDLSTASVRCQVSDPRFHG